MISVWDPHTQDNKAKLEKVQRRAARFIHNTYNSEVSVTSLLKKLHWTPLEERRTKTKVTLMFKAIKNTIHIPTDHLKFTLAPTRQQQNFFIPYARTNTYRHSFFPKYNPPLEQNLNKYEELRHDRTVSETNLCTHLHTLLLTSFLNVNK